MKEMTGKQKNVCNFLPKAMKTKQGIIEKRPKLRKKFNKYFTSVRTTLASKILIVTKDISE